MSRVLEIRMPRYPECWETCGNCANGEVFILEVLVAPGQPIEVDDNVITLETGKVALDIPSPYAGRVLDVMVTAGDTIAEGATILTLETEG